VTLSTRVTFDGSHRSCSVSRGILVVIEYSITVVLTDLPGLPGPAKAVRLKVKALDLTHGSKCAAAAGSGTRRVAGHSGL
jgi:hypothetical protein